MRGRRFETALEQLRKTGMVKDQPGTDGVHVPSAGGGGSNSLRRARDFKAIIAEESVHVADRPRTTKGDARVLKPIEAGISYTPFPHDAGALANMRVDQVPRFFGALTDPDRLSLKRVPLLNLTAMQNRVEDAKVMAARERTGDRPAVVVRMAGRDYIADGHHRLSAAWLNGEQDAEVRFLDLTPVSNALKGADAWNTDVPIVKTIPEQRLVFGWASVIEENGQSVVDSQGDVISEADLEKAFYGFAQDFRVAGEMHERYDAGEMVECMVFTREKQAALGIDLKKIGAWVGFRVSEKIFDKVKSGEYRAFSIGGSGNRVAV